MEYRLSCLLLALAAAAPLFAAADGSSLLRSTLIVADVDRSIAFYGRLGLRVESDRGGPRRPDSPFPLASAAKEFRLVILQGSDADSGRLGLLSFDDPPAPVLVPERERLGIGDVVLVLRHPDADGLFRELRDAGARLVEPAPVPYEVKRADGPPARGRLFHVYDPDGRLVEVMSPAVDAPPAGQ